MSKEKKEKKLKKIGVLTILGWIVGILFMFIGMGGVLSLDVMGLMFIFAGLIIFPPMVNFLKTRFNINLNGWTRVGFVVIIIFMFIGFGMFQNKESVDEISNVDETNVEQTLDNYLIISPEEVVLKYIDLWSHTNSNSLIENEEKQLDLTTADLKTEKILFVSSLKELNNYILNLKDNCDHLENLGLKVCEGTNMSINSLTSAFLNDIVVIENKEIISSQIVDSKIYVNVSYNGYSLTNSDKINIDRNRMFILNNNSGEWLIEEVIIENGSTLSKDYNSLSLNKQKLLTTLSSNEWFKSIENYVSKIKQLESDRLSIEQELRKNFVVNYVKVYLDNDLNYIIVDYNFKDKGFASTDYLTVEEDATKMFNFIFKKTASFDSVQIISRKEESDAYGNSEMKILSLVEMSFETSKKINWDNFDYTRLDEVTTVKYNEESLYRSLKELQTNIDLYS